MLKSTYKPSPGALQPPPPLLPGWTEHKAPTGHTYYYHAETKESTYKRPSMPTTNPAMSYLQHQAVPQINLSDPAVANAFMAQYTQPPPQQQHSQNQRGGFGGGRGRGGGQGFQPRPRPQPHDKPWAKVPIPNHDPWILVYTKYGRRFAYNPVKNASYWRIPEKLMPAVLELDQARIRQKAEKAAGKASVEEGGEDRAEGPTNIPGTSRQAPEQEPEAAPHDYDSSEYEEVEVTDDEDGDERGDGDNKDGSAPKRQRTDEQADSGPVEFTEADIAAQLAAMGASYGGGDDDENMEQEQEEWEEGDEGLPLSDSDARELFKDLLNDFRINPYSPWDKLIEEGKVFDDARYSVLPTTKARKDVWEEWSREKIVQLREQRAKEEKKDPRIPYMQFLADGATPKLYWPEFKRKYKKEACMRDAKLSDKDRERWYREHISRLKLPQATLKSDLKKLMESVPPSGLNNTTTTASMPPQILSDIRYISLDPQIRDPFVEAYIQGLGPPPEEGEREREEEDEQAKKARDERRKREQALYERENRVAEEKRKQEKKLAYERARLRDEEREIERAMMVGKKGLQSQLGAAADRAQIPSETAAEMVREREEGEADP